MSTNIGGNPANCPRAINVPSDGDTETAASVNGAFGGLMDRTEWNRKHHQMVAKNWLVDGPVSGKITIGSGGTFNNLTLADLFHTDSSAFPNVAPAWTLLTGDATASDANVHVSVNGGLSWTAIGTLFTSTSLNFARCVASPDAFTYFAVGYNATGHAPSSSGIGTWNGATWSVTGVSPLATSLNNVNVSAITWFNAQFVAAWSADGTPGVVSVSYSPTGASWTAGPGFGYAGTSSVNCVFAQSSTQLALFRKYSPATQVQFDVSSDGQHWTNINATGASFGGSTITDASWDSVNNVYVVLTSDTNVWAIDPNNGYLTTLCSLSGAGGSGLAIRCLGSLWLTTDSFNVRYSQDVGATWHPVAISRGSSGSGLTRVCASRDQFVVFDGVDGNSSGGVYHFSLLGGDQ